MKRAHSAGPIKCEVCGVTLKNYGSWKSHYARQHAGSESVKCPDCGQVFPFKGTLRRHYYYKHSKIKPYQCGACGASYVESKECALHIATKHELWTKEFAVKNYQQIVAENPAFVKNGPIEIKWEQKI